MSSASFDGLSLTSLLGLLEVALPVVRELQKKEVVAAERARCSQRPVDLVVALLPRMIEDERRQGEAMRELEARTSIEWHEMERRNEDQRRMIQEAERERQCRLEGEIAALRVELAELRGRGAPRE